MAKITIEIDTHDADAHDEAILAVVATYATARSTDTAYQVTGEHQEYRDAIPITPEPAPAPKTRGKKAAAAPATDSGIFVPTATPAAATEAASLFAPPSSTPSSLNGANGGEVTLPMINALLVQLLAPGSSHNAEDLTVIVKEVTHDEAISPKHCDPKYWPEIYERFQALV